MTTLLPSPENLCGINPWLVQVKLQLLHSSHDLLPLLRQFWPSLRPNGFSEEPWSPLFISGLALCRFLALPFLDDLLRFRRLAILLPQDCISDTFPEDATLIRQLVFLWRYDLWDRHQRHKVDEKLLLAVWVCVGFFAHGWGIWDGIVDLLFPTALDPGDDTLLGNVFQLGDIVVVRIVPVDDALHDVLRLSNPAFV